MNVPGLTPWLDPFQWTGTDWAAIGTVIALVALGFAFYQWRRSQGSEQPKITFGALRLLGPGEHTRPNYQFAIELTVTNVSTRSAAYVTVGVVDPRSKTNPKRALYCELYGAPSLAPHASLTDHLGMRGQDQNDDPTAEEALAFYERCVAFVECWDGAEEYYVFTPGKGGRVPKRQRDWASPMEQRQWLEAKPSRGAAPRSLGLGKFEDET